MRRPVIWLFLAGSFMLGAISFSQWIARRAGLDDLRTVGSKNPGATNLLHLAGPRYAVPAAFLDAFKGGVPIVVASATGLSPWLGIVGGALSVLGHIYSPFLKFSGGKGMATGVGLLWGLDAPAAAISTLTGFGIYKLWLRWAPGSVLVILLTFLGISVARRKPAHVIVAPFVVGLLGLWSWLPDVIEDRSKGVPPALRHDGSTF